MTDRTWLTEQFEQARPHLRSVAYGILGSVSEAEDAVQECWLRLDRSDPAAIADLHAWLRVVIGRICLDLLRARRSRCVDYVGSWLPEPLVVEPTEHGPAPQAEMVDSIGMALLVVLECLTPAERLAFMLHDIFALPYPEIATIVDRTPDAARQPGPATCIRNNPGVISYILSSAARV